MKEYERVEFTVTEFEKADVIVTSGYAEYDEYEPHYILE